MPIELLRHRALSDGRIEVFRPLKNADGYYVLADRAVDQQHNKAANQFYVKDIFAVAARLRRGNVSLRMRGEITGQPNLISAAEIEIRETSVAKSVRDPDEDPFLAFTEWSEAADEEAWKNL